jgi:hypothetical protein
MKLRLLETTGDLFLPSVVAVAVEVVACSCCDGVVCEGRSVGILKRWRV